MRPRIIASLQRTRAVDVTQGLPRIFLYSDLTRFDFPGATDVKSARELGLRLGEQARIDFDRAELYVVSSGSAGPSDIAREVMHAFFLQSRARLVNFSGTPAIANLVGNPASVQIFQGKIAYPNGSYPMRMRLAVDRNGTAVNSWVSVQSDVERFTPFNGFLTCDKDNKECKFIGDKVFAQIWTKNPDPNPEFEAWMPFAGMREFEFAIDGDKLSGMAFDSAANVTGTSDNKLKFDLTRLTTGAY